MEEVISQQQELITKHRKVSQSLIENNLLKLGTAVVGRSSGNIMKIQFAQTFHLIIEVIIGIY